MKIWIIFLSVLLLIACSSNPNRTSNTHASPLATSNAQILKTTAGGITVSSHGKGDSRVKAEKSMLRRAIKETIPMMAGNVYNSPGLKKTITQWVNEQQPIDYEDMVKRWAFDIDTQQGDEYFLEGKVILDHAYLKSQVDSFIQECRRTKQCGGRLSIYITPDASVPLSAEDIKLGRSFMYSLQQQFINAGFEIKKANQQREAQYQLKLVEVIKEKKGQNLNAHFTVEALDNKAAGAVFTTKRGSASSSIVIGGIKVAENRVLERAAKAVGANLTQQIIKYNSINEVIFYAKGDYSSDIEQRLTKDLVNLYGITTQGIINVQNTTANGFTSWSFEVPALSRSADLDFKQGLMQIQKSVLNADNPNAKSSKAGRKWSSYDGANPPEEFVRGPISDFETVQVEQLIREGKLDTPPGSGHNAFDTVRARLNEYPGDPNAKLLLQRISEVFIKNSETALDKNQIRQAQRYADRAKKIWPENPEISKLQSEISNTTVIVPTLPIIQNVAHLKTNPNLKLGKQVLEKGKYWALLIGNQDYTEGMVPLKTPLADIRSLKIILEKDYGFERVISVKNGTKETITKALYDLQLKINKNDSFLIFYAGHGELEIDFGEKGFWVPIDGKPRLAKSLKYLSSWIPNSLVHDFIQSSKAKHVLLVSDSCFAGTFKTSTRGLSRQKASPETSHSGLSKQMYHLASLSSRKAISSGDLQPVADGGGGGHSIFAYHLLKALNEKKPIAARNLYQTIKKPIINASSQHPQYFVIDSKHDEGGEFIFVPR